VITLKQWLELADYRITEGSDYRFFSDHAYSLTAWNGDHNGYSLEIIFDQQTQVVYAVEACDYKHNRAYRLINPDYADLDHDKNAWDDTKWVDLDVDDDFMEKALAIKSGEDYDTRVTIQLDLPHDLLHKLMLMAHKADMTLNEFVVELLQNAIDNREVLN
jgi:hypothetical protein